MNYIGNLHEIKYYGGVIALHCSEGISVTFYHSCSKMCLELRSYSICSRTLLPKPPSHEYEQYFPFWELLHSILWSWSLSVNLWLTFTQLCLVLRIMLHPLYGLKDSSRRLKVNKHATYPSYSHFSCFTHSLACRIESSEQSNGEWNSNMASFSHKKCERP